MVADELLAELASHADSEYKKFNEKIVNSNLQYLGVRTPILRKIAKRYVEHIVELLAIQPMYHEQVLVTGIAICLAKVPLSTRKQYIRQWLPQVDNWAAIDTSIYKQAVSENEEMLAFDKELIDSGATFYMRYGIVHLFSNFASSSDTMDTYALIISSEYYVNMAIAWGISVMLVKDYEMAVQYIEQKRFGAWVHNKAIQKAIESFRISDERKKYLRSLKIK